MTTYYPHKLNPVGGTFIYRQVSELKKYFNKIYVFSLIPYIPRFLYDIKLPLIPEGAKYNSAAENYSYDNIYVYFIKAIRLPKYFLGGYGDRLSRKAINIIKKRNLRFNVIHAHFSWPTGYVAAKIKKTLDKKVVLTVHENSDWFIEEIKQARKKYIFAWQLVDKIIRVNKKDVKEFAKVAVDLSKVVTIANGFSKEHFKPMDIVESRRKLGLPVEKKILLNIGNLEEYKGQKYLVESMAKVVDKRKDVLLYILGKGPLKEKLIQQVKENKLEDFIIFAGSNKPMQEIPLWFNSCDLFVLSSLSEGNPTVMFEALGCGKPFIGTNVGGIPEIIINEKLGLLTEPRNSQGLAENILKSLEINWDFEYIEKYSQEFTWENIAKKINELYKLIL